MSPAEALLALVPVRQTTRRSSGGLPRPWGGAVFGLIVLTSTTGCQEQAAKQPDSAIVELTSANFQREVIESEQLVLVEFWAPWCQPCVEMMPAMEHVARQFSGRAKVGKLRIDENEGIASTFEVASPPAVIVFHHGKVIKRRSGKQTSDSLADLVTASLGNPDPRTVEDP